VLGHEPGRALAVVGTDRVPQQPVEQVRAFRLGPVEAPEGLEDQRCVGRHRELLAQERVAGGGQHGLVELAVGRVQLPELVDRGGPGPGDGRGEGVDGVVHPGDLRLVGPGRGALGGQRLQRRPQLVEVDDVLAGQDAHHRALVPRVDHQARALQPDQGLAYRRPGDRELLRDPLLDEPFPRPVHALDDPAVDLLVRTRSVVFGGACHQLRLPGSRLAVP
jgi:hypothetical protein